MMRQRRTRAVHLILFILNAKEAVFNNHGLKRLIEVTKTKCTSIATLI
jgi:hypothetical protein